MPILSKMLAPLLLLVALAFAPARAEAFLSIGAGGGLSSGSGDAQIGYKSTSWYYSGEALLGFLPMLDTGVFYDHNILRDAADITSQGMDFYGLIAQFGLGMVTDLFVDARLGFTKRDSIGLATYDSAFGYGVGLGYKFSIIPMISIKPHVGFRHLPAKITGLDAVSANFWDFGAILSVGF